MKWDVMFPNEHFCFYHRLLFLKKTTFFAVIGVIIMFKREGKQSR